MRPRKPVLLFNTEMDRKTPKQRVTKSSGGFQPPQFSCLNQPARRTNAKSGETRLRTFKKRRHFPESLPTPRPSLFPTNRAPAQADSQPTHKQAHHCASRLRLRILLPSDPADSRTTGCSVCAPCIRAASKPDAASHTKYRPRSLGAESSPTRLGRLCGGKTKGKTKGGKTKGTFYF